MFEQLERIFRAMNRAHSLAAMVATAMRGLELVIEGSRARVVPTGYDTVARLERSGLEKKFILRAEDKEFFYQAQDQGKAFIGTEGVDPKRLHCCVIPFDGGFVYLDSEQPFTSDQAAIAGMIAQQLLAHLNRSSEGLIKADKDVLDSLPTEAWLGNQLHLHDAFSIISLEIDGYHTLREKLGGYATDKVLRELASMLVGLLQSEERLARGQGGEFVILSSRTQKTELSEYWQHAFETFESLGEAQRHKVTLSAGIAVYPVDGAKYQIKDLALAALARAGKVGRRLIMVAEPPPLDDLAQDDPKSHFDARSSAVVKQAVGECQAAHRAVDGIALINAFFAEERKFAELLFSAGLKLKDLRRLIREGDVEKVEFAPAALAVFSLSLEFAHRAGRKSVGIEELFLACLTDSETENQLRECGLRYGTFLVEFYRRGHFHHDATFLLGELSRPEPPRTIVAQTFPKKPVQALPTNFGNNFSADVWGLLAVAKIEAQAARHYLDFPHLYIALLMHEGTHELADRAREAVMKLGLETAPVNVTNPTIWVVDFFRHLGYEHEELSLEALSTPLRERDEIEELLKLMDELGD